MTRSTLERLGHDSLVDVALALMEDLTQAHMEAEEAKAGLARNQRALWSISDAYDAVKDKRLITVADVAEGMAQLHRGGMSFAEMASAIGARLPAHGVDPEDIEPTGAPEGPESPPSAPPGHTHGGTDAPECTTCTPGEAPDPPAVPHSAELDLA